ncbi:Transcription factor CBF/NF-Y/archaeal histone [Lasiodiplodia theobromae]|uniref:DNA polymerase epsilon subunit C n=2 Tax=Lasiodiplodia TaxID=66739 RepID=A0A5N5DMM8_9PEZI|nr:Transcription factor [Lasiodiplodia theobromae]KAB2579186.1 DNA polymerase epsilon subunit C [Lasiodiplodia theobromae]KAF4537239.1 Transcription factor [Lasiodiplodia theobromae]KAF9639796.1 Transcription factor CBF/NF-Y/archaeal histone [Lasiodiplodia theobromae]KAK0661770.1 DNA polymerase epsilon subunit C [Lasiodiplodia hormozganensis]
MPYNNNPIPRPANITGSVSLPLARVKKIIQADEDINACSANAAFAIAVATEEFVYYLTEQAHKMAKAEKKPKRSLGYTHVQQAVARLDNLEFLTDVVPKTQSYKDAKAEREKKKAAQAAAQEAAQANGTVPNGQATLTAPVINGQPSNSQATAGAEKLEPEPEHGGDAMDVDPKPTPA